MLKMSKRFGRRARRFSSEGLSRKQPLAPPSGSNVIDSAATQIQTLVRMTEARKRTVRQEEVLNWSQPEVRKSRQKLSNMVYLWFGLYLGTVTWVTLCYVLTYDTVTIWSWVTATAWTISIDVVLRKPLTVLGNATLHTIQERVRKPEKTHIEESI